MCLEVPSLQEYNASYLYLFLEMRPVRIHIIDLYMIQIFENNFKNFFLKRTILFII